MNRPTTLASTGQVASLHLHPREAGMAMVNVQEIAVVQSKGILDEPRYFAKISRSTGQPSKRQVTLIEREQIAEHSATLSLQSIPPGAVRSNIETSDINLISLIGKDIEIGEAVLRLYAPREPCAKMDAICQGLRELMMNNRQGVLAQVIRSGKIQVGDTIKVRMSARKEAIHASTQ